MPNGGAQVAGGGSGYSAASTRKRVLGGGLAADILAKVQPAQHNAVPAIHQY